MHHAVKTYWGNGSEPPSLTSALEGGEWSD